MFIACDRLCHNRCSRLSSCSTVVDFQCPALSGEGEVLKIQEMIEVDSGVIRKVNQFYYLGNI